ncbi:mechanosensitive ion channel [Candidatus Woesearchaeota archaeon]|nr:mechanosensitive ion channel [Candidatus Woesearchaeota archaeon]
MGFVEILDQTFTALQVPLAGVVSQFIIAIFILLVGFILAKILGRIVYKLLHSFEINNSINKLTRVSVAVEEIAGSFTTYFVCFVTIVMVLQQMGIATTILHMISAGVIIIIILSTFLGIKDFIPNAIAGLFIQREQMIKVGETIKVKGITGSVTDISLVETKLLTKTGDVVYVPNRAITKTEVIKIRQQSSRKKSKIRP